MRKTQVLVFVLTLLLSGIALQADELTAQDCLECHEEMTTAPLNGDRTTAYDAFTSSVHGQAEMACTDCHADIEELPHEEELAVVDCAVCHDDENEAYSQGFHRRRTSDHPNGPVSCARCHGSHDIQHISSAAASVSRREVAGTCAGCHQKATADYARSVHGRQAKEGNFAVVVCTDCHGEHNLDLLKTGRVAFDRGQVSEMCGNCHRHSEIKKEYDESVHGTAFKRGASASPTCTDCHGEHMILGRPDPDSPVYATRLAKEICGRCHDSLVVSRKYGLPEGSIASYYESYHGMASRLGDTSVANCTSCHGAHHILPHTDERSTIHPSNLRKTCGACHPGVSEAFAAGLVHISPTSAENFLPYLIRQIYIVVIVLLIGGMMLHNLLIILYYVRRKYRQQVGEAQIEWMTSAALVQHLALAITFVVLVVSGFSLTFPESGFSQLMKEQLGFSEAARSLVHRLAALGLVVALFWHVAVIIITVRGRRRLLRLLFYPQDVRDAIHNMAYHAGLAKTKPRFGRYDYTQKMEYWGLIWGTVIMTATGLILWFPMELTAWLGLSRVWFEVAQTIHYYEALLAALTIVVWHFFFVVFHPHEYPMAISWLTGKLPLADAAERHPKEIERLVDIGRISAEEAREALAANGHDQEDSEDDKQ
ncbi:cytochrome c3 family protein [Candidatus Sumerlaeota bacterium]